MEITDPIIDEIHAIREAISEACGNDMQKIAKAIRTRQNSGNREVVTLPPKRIVEKGVLKKSARCRFVAMRLARTNRLRGKRGLVASDEAT